LIESNTSTSLLSPFIENLYRMAWIVEARDPYTGGHLWRVSQFSRLLAADLGLSASEVARVELGGFLHDLGKVGVPDAVLNKPGPLDEHEYALIKTHPRIGARLLRGHPLAMLAHEAVIMHHERPDGKGYPDGLFADSIPLIAKIVGLCDAFDAMTSTRPYRHGMSVAKAMSIIEESSGRQFDGDLSTRLARLGGEGQLDHIVGHTDQGIPIMSCAACGPTITVRRDQKVGEYVYCHHCGSQARFKSRNGETVEIEPTGQRGSAEQLEPEVDEALLSELVAGAYQHLAPRYRNLLAGER
jgi:DNA-directed RNA polymerase subunit RPC12/RpoP